MGACCGKHKLMKKRSAVHQHPRDFNPESLKFYNINFHNDEEAITSNTNIAQVYNFKKAIGHGHFGTVRIATLIHDPQQRKFAVKSIEKAKIKKELHFLKRELMILKRLDHPNIVKFYETYQDDKFFYLVMEYCSGGELLERIVEKGKLEEREVAKIMRAAFSAVKHLHSMGIVHRDLKPENFLFASRDPDAEVKLIDFGLSKFLGDNPEYKLTSFVGTALYVAPEVIKGCYDERCDNWSLGVLMYVLLSGNPPFEGENPREVFHKISLGKYSMNGLEWRNISRQAKDLVSKLLVIDKEKRFSASQALKHEWFTSKFPSKPDRADPTVLNMFKNFRSGKKFKNEALKVMVNFLSEAELKKLTETFRSIDTENTGYISVIQLEKAMKDLGYDYTIGKLEALMKTIKIDSSRPLINYTEFIAATMDKKNYITKERLWAGFKHFDVDNTNEITVSNIREALARAGRKISDDDIKKMIKEVDLTKDGKISFDEFVHLMREGENEAIIEEISLPTEESRKESIEFTYRNDNKPNQKQYSQVDNSQTKTSCDSRKTKIS